MQCSTLQTLSDNEGITEIGKILTELQANVAFVKKLFEQTLEKETRYSKSDLIFGELVKFSILVDHLIFFYISIPLPTIMK